MLPYDRRVDATTGPVRIDPLITSVERVARKRLESGRWPTIKKSSGFNGHESMLLPAQTGLRHAHEEVDDPAQFFDNKYDTGLYPITPNLDALNIGNLSVGNNTDTKLAPEMSFTGKANGWTK